MTRLRGRSEQQNVKKNLYSLTLSFKNTSFCLSFMQRTQKGSAPEKEYFLGVHKLTKLNRWQVQCPTSETLGAALNSSASKRHAK